MSIENEITDVRDAKDFRMLTISGYKKSEVKKELINNLCESNIEPSCYWSAELICSGHFIDLWDILINFYTKHIHIGSPMLAMHIERRINDFKNVVTNGFVENELLMRNNKKIRQLFAEIVSIFCVTSKKHKLEEVKMNPEYFDMTNITNKLHAPDISYASIVFKEDDPKEVFVAINELSYTLSNKHGDVLMACFWVEWIMEYKKIKVKQKNPCVCERRFISSVNEKYQKEVDWIIWELIIKRAEMKRDKRIVNIVKALHSIYNLKYSPSTSYKKRKYVVYFALSLVSEDVFINSQILSESNKTEVKNICSSIDNIYKQVKEREQGSATDYLFVGLNKNLEDTVDKLEKMKEFSTQFTPRI